MIRSSSYHWNKPDTVIRCCCGVLTTFGQRIELARLIASNQIKSLGQCSVWWLEVPSEKLLAAPKCVQIKINHFAGCSRSIWVPYRCLLWWVIWIWIKFACLLYLVWPCKRSHTTHLSDIWCAISCMQSKASSTLSSHRRTAAKLNGPALERISASVSLGPFRPFRWKALSYHSTVALLCTLP